MKKFTELSRWARDMYAARFTPEGIRLLSGLYWRSVLIGAGVLLAVVLVYSVQDVRNVLNDLGQTPDTSAPPPPALSRSALSTFVHAFETRQAQFNDAGSNLSPTISDPSR